MPHTTLATAAMLPAMVICMLLAGVSYALISSLAQLLGPRRPD